MGEQKPTTQFNKFYFYQLLELWPNKIGLNGRLRVLKSICEALETLFGLESGHLRDELAHISFHDDESVCHLNNSQEWINKITNSGSSTCDDIFKECSKSVLSIFTEIVDYLYNIKNFPLNKTFY